MAKDPAFLFYPADYISGTMGMTFEEKGAYIELLMYQFNCGHMTSHMVGRMVGQLWDNIKHKFKQDDDGNWYNVRLDVEKDKRRTYSESRRNNLKGTNQYTKKERGHMTSHVENVNINENINIIKRFNFKKGMLENSFKENLVDEWLKVRKSKKLTNSETALNGFIREVELTGIDKNEILRLCIERSWGGFKASWMQKELAQTQKKSTIQHNMEVLKQVHEYYDNQKEQ